MSEACIHFERKGIKVIIAGWLGKKDKLYKETKYGY